MKKLAVLIVALAAFASQAASFNWGTGTVKVSFDGTALTTAASAATGYLVLLTTGSVSDLYTVDYTTPGSITGASYVSDKETTSSGLANAKGRIAGSYSSSSIANGQVYGMYITFTDSAGKQWFNFSSDTYTISGVTLGNEALTAAAFGFDFASKTEITSSAQSISAGGGWHSINIPPVPEPSTAMLALAGLALLIKRRKA